MAKREVHEEHENHERWLVSYADFITLLFAFFVVLYSTSRIDNKRMVDVVKSIKFAMHFKGQGGVDTMPIFDGPASEGGCQANLSDSERPSQKQIESIEAMRRRMEKKFEGLPAGETRTDHGRDLAHRGQEAHGSALRGPLFRSDAGSSPTRRHPRPGRRRR